jgi:hypothetical protein
VKVWQLNVKWEKRGKKNHFKNQNFLYWESFNAFYFSISYLMGAIFIFIFTLP